MTRPDHERFMRRCLELAAEARNQGNTPVGSVVVLDGAIIGQGIEALPTGPSITGHAETLAARRRIDSRRPNIPLVILACASAGRTVAPSAARNVSDSSTPCTTLRIDRDPSRHVARAASGRRRPRCCVGE